MDRKLHWVKNRIGEFGHPSLSIAYGATAPVTGKEAAFASSRPEELELWPALSRSAYTEEAFGLFGPLTRGIGYGYGSLCLLQGLHQLGKRIFVDPRYPGTLALREHPHLIETEPLREVLDYQSSVTYPYTGLMHTVPDEFRRTGKGYAQRVGFTMWETDTIPAEHTGPFNQWAEKINSHCDLLLTPSQHSREVFLAGGVTVPIKVVNYGIPMEEWPLGKAARRKDDVFTILLFGDLSTRKSPFELFRAFNLAFPNQTDVRLILKTQLNRLGNSGTSLPRLQDPRVQIINQRYSHQQMVELIQSAHLFAWPSRGEGFGLPPIQVAAMGIPVAMTTHTGMAEYFHEDYFHKIEHTAPEESAYCGKWLPPDVEQLAHVLKSVYQNYRAAQVKAKKAASFVRERFTTERFASDYLTSVS